MTSRVSPAMRFAAFALAGFLPLSGAMATETITYIYDAQGRLIQVVHGGTVNDTVTATYTHDAADNRVEVVVTGSPNPPPQ